MTRAILKLVLVSVLLISGFDLMGCSKKKTEDAGPNEKEGITEVGSDGKPVNGDKNNAKVNQHGRA